MNRKHLLDEHNCLKILVFSVLSSVILFLIYGGDLLFDEFEHMRVAYLTGLGFHPYKDFFEHHHPLLWWIWAPIIKILPHKQIFLLYFLRIATTLLSCGSAYYIFQIVKRFLGGTKSAIYALLIYFSFYFAQTTSIAFKPDAYMWFFYLCGLYHFFLYIDNGQRKQLYITATVCAISFMFLQTAVFLLLPIGLSGLYLLYRHPSKFKDFALGVIPGLLLLAIFFTVIHLTSGIIPYYQRNWILNSGMYHFMKFPESAFWPKFLIFAIIGYLAYGYQIKKHRADIYTHIAALILTVNMLQNIIIPSPYPRYFQLSALAIAFLTAPVLPQLPTFAKNYFLAALFVFNLLNVAVSIYILPNRPYLQQIKVLDKKDALVYTPILNIYTAHYPYYWFFPTLEAFDDYLFGHPFDVNTYIIENKINYLSVLFDADLKPATIEKEKQNSIIELFKKHYIDPQMIDKHFKLVENGNNQIYYLK